MHNYASYEGLYLVQIHKKKLVLPQNKRVDDLIKK
jgi:hypothetical protein